MSQSGLHGRIWKHGNIMQIQRLKDILVEIVIQGQTGYALHEKAGPINIYLDALVNSASNLDGLLPYPIFPPLSWLVHQRL